jgi:hypothetical protein
LAITAAAAASFAIGWATCSIRIPAALTFCIDLERLFWFQSGHRNLDGSSPTIIDELVLSTRYFWLTSKCARARTM